MTRIDDQAQQRIINALAPLKAAGAISDELYTSLTDRYITWDDKFKLRIVATDLDREEFEADLRLMWVVDPEKRQQLHDKYLRFMKLSHQAGAASALLKALPETDSTWEGVLLAYDKYVRSIF